MSIYNDNFIWVIFTDIDLSKIDFRLIARDNLLYDLYKGKKSVEMEYLYVRTTQVKQSLILLRLSPFWLQGNIQIDGASSGAMGAMGFGQKLIEVVKENDFFQETKMYDYDP